MSAESPQPEFILLCDHRGTGLDQEAAFLHELGYRVATTRGLRETLTRIAAEPPALLLVHPLTQEGRVELPRLEEARRGTRVIPMLLLADSSDRAAVPRLERALEGEAWDVMWHGAPSEELKLRVERLLRAEHVQVEMEELRHRASHDDRTDLLRPSTFEERLAEHFSAAQRHHFELALVLIDLDEFGQINKRHDHTVGDELIARVGEVIRGSLRAEDVAGRLGGDEFGVLLPYTAKVDAAQVVRRLREGIQRLSGTLPGANAPVKVSASIGFETYDGRDLDSLVTLRRNCERALRASKRGGGDQAHYWRNLAAAE